MNRLHKTIYLLLFQCSSIVAFAQYEIVPEKGYSTQIGIMVTMLEDLKLRITDEVESITKEQTDFLFDEKANSIGALIMHLAATESYYQVETLENRAWTEEESKLWEIPSSLGSASREKYKGKPIEYYLTLWNQVREKTLLGLQLKDDEWFQSNIDDNVNNHWAWYHVMEHQANHMGQIALVKNRFSDKTDYSIYHSKIVDAETFITSEKYDDALRMYKSLFLDYDFVFLRDYQIATQLALFLNDKEESKRLLIKGIKSGWTMKSIRKNSFLNALRKSEDWKSIKNEYRKMHDAYLLSLDQDVKGRVKKMYKKDQHKAFGALFRLSSKAQDKYAERKFAPHSERQIKEFLEILLEHGYPGEKLIGTETWMSTILSHHNSISREYNRNDTLYQSFKPRLKIALKNGEISAFSYAMIEEWYRAVIKDERLPTYGILDGPRQDELIRTNKLREETYLRSIEVHNKLVVVEEKTGMNFYLDGHPWGKGKIEIR